MNNFITAVTSLANSPLPKFAVLLAFAAMAVWTVRQVLRWCAAEVERHVVAALGPKLDDPEVRP